MAERGTRESAPCRMCGEPLTPSFRVRDLNRGVEGGPFAYGRCGSCGSCSLLNPPAEMGPFYPKGYHGFPAGVEDMARFEPHERYKIGILKRHLPRGRLLEIGPSVGGFLFLARKAGYDVEGIEVDEECCSFLEETLCIPVTRSGDPVAALDGTRPCDGIALWHSIEHLPDPRALIRAAARALKPGGILVVAAPNPGALQFRLFGGHWVHIDAPRHLCLVPPGAFLREAGNAGLAAEEVTLRDEGALHWNLFGWRESLALLAPARLKTFARIGGSLACRVMSPLETTGVRGSAYTAVLRKGGA